MSHFFYIITLKWRSLSSIIFLCLFVGCFVLVVAGKVSAIDKSRAFQHFLNSRKMDEPILSDIENDDDGVTNVEKKEKKSEEYMSQIRTLLILIFLTVGDGVLVVILFDKYVTLEHNAQAHTHTRTYYSGTQIDTVNI